MPRTVRTDIRPVVDDYVDDVNPWFKQKRKADLQHEETVSPLQWKIAWRSAQLPEDENLHDILAESARKLNIKATTLDIYRKVGVAFPNPNPNVYFSVYAELLAADAEHRDEIFAGKPDPVDPKTWTATSMRLAVRRFYDRNNRTKDITSKTVVLRGVKFTLSVSGNVAQIILEGDLDVEVQNLVGMTVLKTTFAEVLENAV